MTYCQITAAERYTLGLLRRQGLTPAVIARILGRHRSTIGRELRRNRTHHDGSYRPQLAQWYAMGRRSRSRRNRRFTAADWGRVQSLVREDWSPVSRHLKFPTIRHLKVPTVSLRRTVWRIWRVGP